MFWANWFKTRSHKQDRQSDLIEQQILLFEETNNIDSEAYKQSIRDQSSSEGAGDKYRRIGRCASISGWVFFALGILVSILLINSVIGNINQKIDSNQTAQEIQATN